MQMNLPLQHKAPKFWSRWSVIANGMIVPNESKIR
jgi:hypothetical protein